MIHIAAIEAARRQMAAAGTNLVAEMAAFLPALWPPHRYDPIVAPNGAWNEGTETKSAPNYPGWHVEVPQWTPVGAADSFAEAEGDKVTNFQNWLFTRKSVEWLANYFAPASGQVFVPFGARGDRSFADGKFPRDEWKAGSFDEDLWSARRVAVASAASEIMQQIDAINGENVVLTPREWILSKFVTVPVIESPGNSDTTTADMPELLEDVSPDWLEFPAYLRVASQLDDGDATWTGAQLAFAWASGRYDQLTARLTSGAFAGEVFDQCFTVWRTGSQTRRRDRYEEAE